MKFQKSPFPYLAVLAAIITLAAYSNQTVNKSIEQPIVYHIENTSSLKNVDGLVNLIEEQENKETLTSK